MKPANLAPVYVGIYPELAELCRGHGYALAVHGSLARDFDLVAIPWVDAPASPEELVTAIVSTFALRPVDVSPTDKGHGRLCWSLVVSHGDTFLDFSVMRPGATAIEEGRIL